MTRIRYRLLLGLPVLILLTSCAARSGNEPFYGESEPPAVQDGTIDSSRSVKSASAEMSIAAEPAPAADGSGGESASGPEEGRKRIYNGSAGIVVEDSEAVRSDLEARTLDAGGYVESSYIDYLELRIPAEQFDEFFEMILTLGKVEYSRVETRDVTDAFADIQRRLSTAQETRSRLYELLEKSTDPGERAKILREIGRLTEEIESLKQQTSIMESRIAFSRISVQLIPRIQGDYSRMDIPFPWIADLDPLYPAGEKLRGHVRLDLGPSFAVFTKDSVYMAEDSSGTQVFISTVPNRPQGDSRFWQQALVFHLGPFYAQLSEKTVQFGDRELLGVELISKDREPFKYYVGVSAEGRNLQIVEIFSPGADIDFSTFYQSFSEGELK